MPQQMQKLQQACLLELTIKKLTDCMICVYNDMQHLQHYHGLVADHCDNPCNKYKTICTVTVILFSTTYSTVLTATNATHVACIIYACIILNYYSHI